MEERGTEAFQEKGEQPLYEFPSGDTQQDKRFPQPAPLTQQESNATRPEAVAYPPPPSFYQNMPIPAERPSLPPVLPERSANRQFPVVPQGAAQTVYAPFPPPSTSRLAKKRPRKWIWFVVITLAIAVLGSCGFCGWAFYNIFHSTVQQIGASQLVVTDYFSNLQARNYTAAYQDDLALNTGLSLDQFVQQAQERDTQYGPVTAYQPGAPAFRSDPTIGQDLSHAIYIVDVTRANLHYTVTLAVSQVGGAWKITSLDAI